MSGGNISLLNLTKTFNKNVVVDDITLQIHGGEFFSIVGSSGCGKTTTLRMIAGFDSPSAGQIMLDGENINLTPAYKRNVNTVFQSYALFPHLNVYENIAFGLKRRKCPKNELARRVDDIVDLVHLTGLVNHKPNQLSGGQQQRVALARALVLNPSVLLLDEPLGALDAKLRRRLQVDLKALQRRVGTTFVYVTHDQEEALTMSDRVAVMSGGRLEQVGTPREVYESPASEFVADFLGISNFLDAEALGPDGDAGCLVRLGESTLRARRGAVAARGPVRCVIRPESLAIFPPGKNGENFIPGVIDKHIYIGNSTQVIVQLNCGCAVQVLVQHGGDTVLHSNGSEVAVYFPADELTLFTAS